MHRFFSKLGYKKRQGEWFPILVTRICLGIFFILSGFFKIFHSKQHAALLETLHKANIPYPEFNAYLLPTFTFIGGILVFLGLLCSLASFVLFIIMIIAIMTDHAAGIALHGGLLSIENFFYLPEVLYAIIFLWLFFSGPGKVSLDCIYDKKRGSSI